ncbi:MAG TPA: hypothetical protein VK723_05030, partial [Thermoplasmata archaeon]|nr:hypothetical protein [Thermoplasmata archaeon]
MITAWGPRSLSSSAARTSVGVRYGRNRCRIVSFGISRPAASAIATARAASNRFSAAWTPHA